MQKVERNAILLFSVLPYASVIPGPSDRTIRSTDVEKQRRPELHFWIVRGVLCMEYYEKQKAIFLSKCWHCNIQLRHGCTGIHENENLLRRKGIELNNQAPSSMALETWILS